MEGGELQKLKLEQTKQLVRKGMGLSRKRRESKSQSQDLQISSDDSVPNSPVAVTSQLPESSFPSGGDLAIQNSLVHPEPAPSNDNELEILFQLGEIYDTGNGQTCPDHNYDHDETYGSILSDHQNYQSPGTHDLYDFASLDNQNCNPLPRSQDLDPNYFSNLSSSGSQIPFAQRLSSPEEADLLLYYMEIVCEKQFLVIAKANRGWLCMAITKSDLVYWATLSLASYYQGSSKCVSSFL